MKKIILIGLILLIIWGSFFYLLLNYSHELRTHPCSLCAEKIGDDISCKTTGLTSTFYLNGSVEIINNFKWEGLENYSTGNP